MDEQGIDEHARWSDLQFLQADEDPLANVELPAEVNGCVLKPWRYPARARLRHHAAIQWDTDFGAIRAQRPSTPAHVPVRRRPASFQPAQTRVWGA